MKRWHFFQRNGAKAERRGYWLSFKQVSAAVSLFGFGALCYLVGAGVMHFHLPTSAWLANGLQGTGDWFKRTDTPMPPKGGNLPDPVLSVFREDDAWPGFTLYTTTFGPGATLINLKGDVVHQWQLPSGVAWAPGKDVTLPKAKDYVHWERCHLFPNGDVIALCSTGGDMPYGFGVAKLDKDSKLIWTATALCHHDLDVGEDGRIYVLTKKITGAAPPNLAQVPTVEEEILVLSAAGNELETIPLLPACRESNYHLVLLPDKSPERDGFSPRRGPPPLGGFGPPPLPGGGGPAPLPGGFGPPSLRGITNTAEYGDLFHTNSIKVLPRSLAAKYPLFKPGQLLVSLRSPSALAVIDPSTRAVVWAAKGVWQGQHNAQFLDNGHLLLFDNLGAQQFSRTIEYDPVTQAVPWSYPIGAPVPGEKGISFLSPFRCGSQRLPNGNTLIIDAADARLTEVTPSKEIAWQWGCSPSNAPPGEGTPAALNITGARRFGPEELPFLKEPATGPPK